jgi:hypothetical protein
MSPFFWRRFFSPTLMGDAFFFHNLKRRLDNDFQIKNKGTVLEVVFINQIKNHPPIIDRVEIVHQLLSRIFDRVVYLSARLGQTKTTLPAKS